MEKRMYLAPAVAEEDVVERTSLACNSTAIVMDLTPECDAQANQKNGSWWAEDGFCDNPVFDGEPVCFPSEIGVVLS